MDLKLKSTKLVAIGDIEIPEVFTRRFKSGIEKMDILFGDIANPGILPGSSFCLWAGPGSGKTTLMLQYLEALCTQGYECAIVSGEESIFQIAYTAKRIGVSKVHVANETDFDKIAEMTKKYDVVIIDSFQAMRCDPKKHPKIANNKNKREEYGCTKLLDAGHKNECVIGFILHVTKGGGGKGGMILFHAPDALFYITKSDDTNVRFVHTDKNRFGKPNSFSAGLNDNGFDFSVEAQETQQVQPDEKAKGVRKKHEMFKILSWFNDEQKEIDFTIASNLIGDLWRARCALSDLHVATCLVKSGRGKDAKFVITDEGKKMLEQLAPLFAEKNIPIQVGDMAGEIEALQIEGEQN